MPIPGPGNAVTREGEWPNPKEYCCFKKEYLAKAENFFEIGGELQKHKSAQSLGIYNKQFDIVQALDGKANLIPTGHFTPYGITKVQMDHMVIDDGQKVKMEDNFDYDPSRPGSKK